MPKVLEVDCTTGVATERDLTPEEEAKMEEMAVLVAQREAEQSAAQVALDAAKTSAHAKLTELGLTAEEISALSK
jgi:hypothetical protein